MRGKRWALIFVAATLLVAAGGSWTLAAEGGVRVTVYEVTDSGNEPMPGATVTLSHPGGQVAAAGGMTDENGQALFPTVPVGTNYVVKVSMPGYATTVRDGVKVVPSQITDVVVALTEEKTETVTVRGKEKLIDLERGTESKTQISADFFDDLPVLGREYQQVLTLAPGVNDIDGDGNPTVHGSRARDFQTQVDGVSNVDPLTGYFMSNINPDAIEEIEVTDFGADASYGGAVGGYARIHTKSGSNQFEGTFNFFFRDSSADNDRAGGIDPVDFGRIQPSIFLSGPLVRNRLWWVVSHEYLDQSDPVIVLAGDDFVQQVNRWSHFDKLTWQASAKSKVTLTFNADPQSVSPWAATSNWPKESNFNVRLGGPTYALTWNVPYSPTFAIESLVAFSDNEVSYGPVSPWTTLPNGLLTGGLLNSCVGDSENVVGEEYLTGLLCRDRNNFDLRSGSFNEDYVDHRRRWTYRVEGDQFINEWLGGSHQIRFGAQIQRNNFERDDLILNELSREGSGLVGGALDTNAAGLAEGLQAFNLIETVYAPKEVSTLSQEFPIAAPSRVRDDVTANSYHFYISDTYEPWSNVVLNFGLRVQREEISSRGFVPFDPAAERAAWNDFLDACMNGEIPTSAAPSQINAATCFRAMGGSTLFTTLDLYAPRSDGCSNSLNPALCEFAGGSILVTNGFEPTIRTPDRISIRNNGVSPRFSFSWDPWSNGKTKISGSFGRDYGDSFLLPFAMENGPDSMIRQWALNNRKQVLKGSKPTASGGMGIRTIDRNVKMQHQDEWALQFQREIAPETSLTLSYVNRKYYDQLQDTDINRTPVLWEDLPGLAAAAGIDASKCQQVGKYADCFGLVQVRLENRGGLNGVVAVKENVPDDVPDLMALNPFFTSILQVGNFNRSWYEAYILKLERRFYQNWELYASYTWSKSIGQADDFFGQVGNDATVADDEFGFLSDDQRHVFKVNGRVVVPWWGGIRIGGFFQYSSGRPYSLIESRFIPDFPSVLSKSDTADYSDKVRLTQETATRRITYPTGQRNDQRVPSWWTFDVNAEKEFNLKDINATLQFGIFNLLNSDDLQDAALVQFRQRDPKTKEFRFFRQLVAQRRSGRQFEIAFKLKF